MSEELLEYDGLADKDELRFLLFDALPVSNHQKVSDFKKYCTSNRYALGRSFDETLKLLAFMTFIDVSKGTVLINDKAFNPAEIEEQEEYLVHGGFVRSLLLSMKREGLIGAFIRPDALRWDVTKSIFYVKENLIPLRFFAVRNLLISLGVFEWDSTLGSGSLLITPDATQLFSELVVESLRAEQRDHRKRISLVQLRDRLARQDELGEEAELFAIQFEQKRLKDHPNVGDIRRMSEEYANAGYDIESFNDNESVFLDRYIEVKSYSSVVAFHWSRNEVDTARRLADNYFLYLVDRDKVPETGYSPRVFQDPFQRIFESEYWNKDPETWIVSMR